MNFRVGKRIIIALIIISIETCVAIFWAGFYATFLFLNAWAIADSGTALLGIPFFDTCKNPNSFPCTLVSFLGFSIPLFLLYTLMGIIIFRKSKLIKQFLLLSLIVILAISSPFTVPPILAELHLMPIKRAEPIQFWKTFTNTKYKFSIRYPSTVRFFSSSIPNNVYLSTPDGEDYQQIFGGEIDLPVTNPNYSNGNTKAISKRISVGVIIPIQHLPIWLKNPFDEDLIKQTYTKVKIGNNDWYTYPKKGKDATYYTFSKDYAYEISLIDWLPQDKTDILSKVISSFQILP